MSFRVSDGIGSGTPGRLTPLCELTTPPTRTAHGPAACHSLDAEADEPVVDQDFMAGLQHLADHRGQHRQFAVVRVLVRR